MDKWPKIDLQSLVQSLSIHTSSCEKGASSSWRCDFGSELSWKPNPIYVCNLTRMSKYYLRGIMIEQCMNTGTTIRFKLATSICEARVWHVRRAFSFPHGWVPILRDIGQSRNRHGRLEIRLAICWLEVEWLQLSNRLKEWQFPKIQPGHCPGRWRVEPI